MKKIIKILIVTMLTSVAIGSFIGCGSEKTSAENEVQEYHDKNANKGIVNVQMFWIYSYINKDTTPASFRQYLKEQLIVHPDSFNYSEKENEDGIYEYEIKTNLCVNVIVNFRKDETWVIDKVFYQDTDKERIIVRSFEEEEKFFISADKQLYQVENIDIQNNFIESGIFKGKKV